LALYQGRFSEQARLLEQGANADLQAKTPENATNKFAALAYAELLRGQSRAAVAAAERALANGQSLQSGSSPGAFLRKPATRHRRKNGDSLAKETQAEPQAYGKIIEGKLALKQGTAVWLSKTSPTLTPARHVDWPIRAWPCLSRSRPIR